MNNRALAAKALRRIASELDSKDTISKINSFMKSNPQAFCDWMNKLENDDSNPLLDYFNQLGFDWSLPQEVKEDYEEQMELLHNEYLEEKEITPAFWENESDEPDQFLYSGKYSNEPDFMKYIRYSNAGGEGVWMYAPGNTVGFYGNASHDTKYLDHVIISKLEDLKLWLENTRGENNTQSYESLVDYFVESWNSNPPNK